jgi:hypothetical protein
VARMGEEITSVQEIGLGGVDWIRLSQDRDRWRGCECGDEPSGSCDTELVSLVNIDVSEDSSSRRWR